MSDVLKIGVNVTVTHPEGSFPSVGGTIIDRTFSQEKGMVVKVSHIDGWENWYPAAWVTPMLRLV